MQANKAQDEAAVGGFTTSDGGRKISMAGSKKAAAKASYLAIAVSCILYGGCYTGLTLGNK